MSGLSSDIVRYNLVRSLDSRYSSVSDVDGSITPQYQGGLYDAAGRRPMPLSVVSVEAQRMREARARMAAERQWELDNKYLLLALARLDRRRRYNTIPVFGGTHECTFKCDTIESSVEKGLWVCIASGNTHKCHSNCELASTETHSDAIVDICPIAGVIRTQALIDFENSLEFGAGFKPLTEQSDVKDAAHKKSLVQLSADYTMARTVLHKLMFSEKRRALDALKIAKCYEDIGEELMKYRDSQVKLGMPIELRYMSETILKATDALRSSCGIVCYGHSMSPQATQELLHWLAARAVALWQAFHLYNAYHVTNGLGGSAATALSRIDAKPKEQKRLSLEYHLIAMLYKMKTGVYDLERGVRWLPKVDALCHLLPNQKDLAALGFKKSDFSKNETSFQTALFNLHREKKTFY